jgi:hypothetical protein
MFLLALTRFDLKFDAGMHARLPFLFPARAHALGLLLSDTTATEKANV